MIGQFKILTVLILLFFLNCVYTSLVYNKFQNNVKLNYKEMDRHLREIQLQDNIPMEVNSSNKNMGLFDKDISILDNSVSQALRTEEICDFDESNCENQEIQPKVQLSTIKNLDSLLDNNHADIEISDKLDEFDCLHKNSNNKFVQALLEENLNAALKKLHPNEDPDVPDSLVNISINNLITNTNSNSICSSSDETVIVNNVNNSLNQLEFIQQATCDLDHADRFENNLNLTVDSDFINCLEKLNLNFDNNESILDQSTHILQEKVQSNTSKVLNETVSLLNDFAGEQLKHISYAIPADCLEDISADDHLDVSTNDIAQVSNQLDETFELNPSPRVEGEIVRAPIASEETIEFNHTIEVTDNFHLSPNVETIIVQDQVIDPKVEKDLNQFDETFELINTVRDSQLNETIIVENQIIQSSSTLNEDIDLNQSASSRVESKIVKAPKNLSDTLNIDTSFVQASYSSRASIESSQPEDSSQDSIEYTQASDQFNDSFVTCDSYQVSATASPRVEYDSLSISNQLNETRELSDNTLLISNSLNETIGLNQTAALSVENYLLQVSNKCDETLVLNQSNTPPVESDVNVTSDTNTCIKNENLNQSEVSTSPNTLNQSACFNLSNATTILNISNVTFDSRKVENHNIHGVLPLNEFNIAHPDTANNVATIQITNLLNGALDHNCTEYNTSNNTIPNQLNEIIDAPLQLVIETQKNITEDLLVVHNHVDKQSIENKDDALLILEKEKQLSRVKLEKDITDSMSTTVHDQIEKQLNQINLNQSNPEPINIVQLQTEHNQSQGNNQRTVDLRDQIKPSIEFIKVESNIQEKELNAIEYLNLTSSVTVDSLKDIPVHLSQAVEINSHMSETTSKPSSHLCESHISRLSLESHATSTNNIDEVMKQNDYFEKQSDIVNGADDCKSLPIDNKKSLEDKTQVYNDMMERLSNAETECEKCKVQIVELKKELKTCRQKYTARESELADLTRRENELMILVEDYKNKKPANDSTDAKELDNELLRSNETALKNEIIEMKELIKHLENNLRDLQRTEAKLSDDLNSKTQTELQISRVMEEYEKSISSLVAENEKMKNERDTAQMHLANIEMAFSDVHQKYERCKTIIQGFKENEESLRQDISVNEDTILNQEQKYETLKAHAMGQLEKSNQELADMKRHHDQELARVTAQLKRYEIKNNSLMETLSQKSKECEQLSAVCDEFIGNV